jgi:hypothetical protein
VKVAFRAISVAADRIFVNHMSKSIVKQLFLTLLLSVPLLAQAQIPNRFEKNKNTPPAEEPVEEEPVEEEPVEEEPSPAQTQSRMERSSSAQSRNTFWRDLQWGGTLSLQFGLVDLVLLNPRVGYPVTEDLQVGMGFTYLYVNDDRFTPPLERSAYGVNPFANYRIFGPVALSAQYELLNTDVVAFYQGFEPVFERDWVHGLYLGGSYMPQGGGLFISLLYTVLYDPNRSIYANPVIQIGFMM